MALPASGQISMNDVNVELSLPGTSQISLNDTDVRVLFGVPSGAISLANGYGCSSYSGNTEAFARAYEIPIIPMPSPTVLTFVSGPAGMGLSHSRIYNFSTGIACINTSEVSPCINKSTGGSAGIYDQSVAYDETSSTVFSNCNNPAGTWYGWLCKDYGKYCFTTSTYSASATGILACRVQAVKTHFGLPTLQDGAMVNNWCHGNWHDGTQRHISIACDASFTWSSVAPGVGPAIVPNPSPPPTIISNPALVQTIACTMVSKWNFSTETWTIAGVGGRKNLAIPVPRMNPNATPLSGASASFGSSTIGYTLQHNPDVGVPGAQQVTWKPMDVTTKYVFSTSTFSLSPAIRPFAPSYSCQQSGSNGQFGNYGDSYSMGFCQNSLYWPSSPPVANTNKPINRGNRNIKFTYSTETYSNPACYTYGTAMALIDQMVEQDECIEIFTSYYHCPGAIGQPGPASLPATVPYDYRKSTFVFATETYSSVASPWPGPPGFRTPADGNGVPVNTAYICVGPIVTPSPAYTLPEAGVARVGFHTKTWMPNRNSHV